MYFKMDSHEKISLARQMEPTFLANRTNKFFYIISKLHTSGKAEAKKAQCNVFLEISIGYADGRLYDNFKVSHRKMSSFYIVAKYPILLYLR